MTDSTTTTGASSPPHLTEEERQGLADGTLPADAAARATAHLARCAACDDDVARLRGVMMRVRETTGARGEGRGASEPALDALWPEIRARIESTKTVPLAEGGPRRRRSARALVWLGGAAAAALIIVVASRRPTPSPGLRPRSPVPIPASDTMVRAVDDSVRAYEREVASLLEELELRRATLRPDVAASMEHDLRVIDAAIAELRDALKQNPNDPALRQLLAASYRQKRDLLKRAGNAS